MLNVAFKGKAFKGRRRNIRRCVQGWVDFSTCHSTLNEVDCGPGREVTTGRQVAIKKIKVGQFKDGLDMSAIREVKYLREVHHPNVIEVCSP